LGRNLTSVHAVLQDVPSIVALIVPALAAGHAEVVGDVGLPVHAETVNTNTPKIIIFFMVSPARRGQRDFSTSFGFSHSLRDAVRRPRPYPQ
jgi:hypothetical protein